MSQFTLVVTQLFYLSDCSCFFRTFLCLPFATRSPVLPPPTTSSAIAHLANMSSSTSVFNQPKPVVKLEQALLDSITTGVQPYPIPEGRKYGYGTAGVSWLSAADAELPLILLAVSHESVRSIL